MEAGEEVVGVFFCFVFLKSMALSVHLDVWSAFPKRANQAWFS